jgi:LEA14-like dessication related protein
MEKDKSSLASRTLALLGVGIFGFVVLRYVYQQLTLLNQYTYQFINARINKVSLQNINFNLKMRINNRSSINATIEEIAIRIFLDNIEVGNVTETNPFTILPTNFFIADINMDIDPRMVLSNAVTFGLDISKLKDLPMDFQGFVRIKTGIVSRVIPVRYSTTFKEYFELGEYSATK